MSASDSLETSLREIDVRLAASEIEATIQPFVQERTAVDSPRWQQVRAKAAARMQRPGRSKDSLLARLGNLITGRRDRGWREWDQHWSVGSRYRPEMYAPGWKANPYEWRDQGLMMSHAGGRRARILVLMRVLEALKPSSALEVGCGDGLNLIPLANRFPDIRFGGAELAFSGVSALRGLQRADQLPDFLAKFSPEPAVDARAYQKIAACQANAAALPFADGSFELTYTCVALEQMESVRDQALREVIRVARSWVVMIEPFRDHNASGLRLQHVTSRNYFSATVADLPSFGLKPLFVSADLPQKLKLAAALVIAAKV